MPITDPDHFPKTGALIGIDPGTKTLGIASADGLRMLASPVETIPRGKKLAPVLDRLFHLYDDRVAVGIVMAAWCIRDQGHDHNWIWNGCIQFAIPCRTPTIILKVKS